MTVKAVCMFENGIAIQIVVEHGRRTMHVRLGQRAVGGLGLGVGEQDSARAVSAAEGAADVADHLRVDVEPDVAGR